MEQLDSSKLNTHPKMSYFGLTPKAPARFNDPPKTRTGIKYPINEH